MFDGVYKMDINGNIWSIKSNRFLSNKSKCKGLYTLNGKRITKTKEEWKRLTFPECFSIDEELKDIPGFKNYKITKDGRVFSCVKHRFIKPSNSSTSQYLSIKLQVNGKPKHISIHRAVALSWIPNPNNFPVVDHIDRNIYNNHVSNLRWVSVKDNIKNSSIGFRRNTRSCLLFYKDKFIKAFTSVKDCCDYASDKYNISWAMLQKYRTYKEFTIKCND